VTKQAIFELISEGVGDPAVVVYWRSQNAPRPEKPACGLQVISIGGPFFPTTQTEPDGAGVVTMGHTVSVSLDVQFFGSAADDRAAALKRRLIGPAMLQSANAKNLAVMSSGDVLSVPSLLNDSQYEERASLSLMIHDAAMTAEEVGAIERVEISGDADIAVHVVRTDAQGAATAPIAAGNIGV
jgi:hypothetical protein